MKGKSLLLIVFSLLLVLGLGGGIGGLWEEAKAKESEAPGQVALLTTLGTTFTYQGRLMDGGSPANGQYDFEFKLYDAASGGTLLGTVIKEDVTVTDGLFTVQLDFGAGVFTGDARWLEIGVRPGSSIGAFTTLTPRQELTATPYALSLRPGAQVVGSVSDASLHYAALYAENSAPLGGYGVYGLVTAGGAATGVYGYANSTAPGGVTFGISGRSDTGAGTGVEGYASHTTGSTRGVIGQVFSPNGYGVQGINNAGGVAIYASGSGIIKSVAETRLAINPFEIEATSHIAANSGLRFLHHWGGWNEIWNDTHTQGIIYVPVHNFITLFGSPQKLKSLEVCYEVTSGSYIWNTAVYHIGSTKGYTTLLNDSMTIRNSTTWTCYAVTTPSPALIDGPMLVYFNLIFAGTGSSHKITIGRMVATLVE